MRENLCMQHLESCLSTDYLLGSLFFISVNEVQLLSSFILLMAAFLTVHAGSWGGLQENLLTFQFLTIHVLQLPRQNEIQLLSRFFCYSKMVCLFGFWAEESFATEFNKS